MTDYKYTQVLMWDNLGGFARVARNQRVNVLDPASCAPSTPTVGTVAPGLTQGGVTVGWLTSGSDGHADFTSTLGTIRVVGPNGWWRDITSPDIMTEAVGAKADAEAAAASAAASAQSAQDAWDLVPAPAKSAMDTIMGGDTTGLVPTIAGKVTRGGVVVLASEYGAVGDGATDDYAALTAALTAIKSLAAFAKSRTLQLGGSRTYLTSAPILLDQAGLNVVGDGQGTTTLKLTSTLTNQSVVKITAANCRIERVTIDCNGKTAWAIWGVTSAGIRASNVTVTGTVQHGIYLNNCDDATLANVTMLNCGTVAGVNPAGLYASECDNLVLDHCHAVGAYQHGYYLLGGTASSLTMTGCTAVGNGGVGISARTNRATITGCYSWGNGQQALALSYVIEPSTKGAVSTITGNVFGGTTTTTANEVSIAMDTVVVTGNVIDSAVATAGVLRFITCTDVTATGNRVSSSIAGVIGLIRFDSCTDYLCSSNKIKGATGGSGIYVSAVSSDGKIAENKINGFANGVTLDATAHNDVHVTNNQCLNCTTRPVTNSSTGTGVMVGGNSLPAAYEFPAPPRLPIYTTAGRPTPASVGTGGMYWDSTLGKPGISTGTAWKDFMTGAVI